MSGFADRHGLTLGEELGRGVQGIVLSVRSQAEEGRLAIKAHKQEAGYLRERDAYLRLKGLGITTIRSCNVPELSAHDDELIRAEGAWSAPGREARWSRGPRSSMLQAICYDGT